MLPPRLQSRRGGGGLSPFRAARGETRRIRAVSGGKALALAAAAHGRCIACQGPRARAPRSGGPLTHLISVFLRCSSPRFSTCRRGISNGPPEHRHRLRRGRPDPARPQPVVGNRPAMSAAAGPSPPRDSRDPRVPPGLLIPRGTQEADSSGPAVPRLDGRRELTPQDRLPVEGARRAPARERDALDRDAPVDRLRGREAVGDGAETDLCSARDVRSRADARVGYPGSGTRGS